jgi:IS30 family transposase
VTLDNGGELVDQIRVSKQAKVAIYFAKNYAN